MHSLSLPPRSLTSAPRDSSGTSAGLPQHSQDIRCCMGCHPLHRLEGCPTHVWQKGNVFHFEKRVIGRRRLLLEDVQASPAIFPL